MFLFSLLPFPIHDGRYETYVKLYLVLSSTNFLRGWRSHLRTSLLCSQVRLSYKPCSHRRRSQLGLDHLSM